MQDVRTPLYLEALGFKCTECEGLCGYFAEQKYRVCNACDSVIFVCKCQSCGSDLGCRAKSLSSRAECPRCHASVITGWPKHVWREQDPSRRLIPVAKLVLYVFIQFI